MLFWLTAQFRRERFVEELEGYRKQVEEFQMYGDMAEMQKYLKKAQLLDGKLQAASDRVNHVAVCFMLPCTAAIFSLLPLPPSFPDESG